MNDFKVFLNKANENWIADVFVKELKKYSKLNITNFMKRSDIVWLIAPWNWKKLNHKVLKQKKILCTIHHIDLIKFDDTEKQNFYHRDKFVDAYHVISKDTEKILSELVDKKIFYSPFWIDPAKFFKIENKKHLREKFGYDNETFLVGSFQRDSEGSNLNLPKLSKGPDQFIEIIKHLKQIHEKIEIILTGYRRDYIINQLNLINVKYTYFPNVDFITLNKLYNILDLYIVASRVEGGPRSIFESALIKTPIISTNVGISSEILNFKSIFNMDNFKLAEPDINYAYNKVIKYRIPDGFQPFYNILKELYEN